MWDAVKVAWGRNRNGFDRCPMRNQQPRLRFLEAAQARRSGQGRSQRGRAVRQHHKYENLHEQDRT